jgi:hypothetical protein
LLTASTGVCRVKKYPIRPVIFLYIYDKQFRFVGIIQVAICLLLIITAVFFAMT